MGKTIDPLIRLEKSSAGLKMLEELWSPWIGEIAITGEDYERTIATIHWVYPNTTTYTLKTKRKEDLEGWIHIYRSNLNRVLKVTDETIRSLIYKPDGLLWLYIWGQFNNWVEEHKNLNPYFRHEVVKNWSKWDLMSHYPYKIDPESLE